MSQTVGVTCDAAIDDTLVVVGIDGIVQAVHPDPADRGSQVMATVRPGSDVWSTAAPERLTQRRAVFKDVLATGRSSRFVDLIDGRWTQVDLHPVPVGAGGAPELVHVLIRDVHSQVEAQEELKRLRLRVLTIQEDERRRIAQDLHDELGQSVTAVLMQLREMGRHTEVDPQTRRSLGEMSGQMEALARSMRQLFYRVRPPSLEHTDLANAVADYCSSLARTSGLRIDVDAESDLPVLADHAASALYRLLQESLHNTVKHAGAANVWVTLGSHDGAVYLSAEDDGAGFDATGHHRGLGLRGMRERFAMLDGEVQIDSRPGAGTRVTGTVPIGVARSTS